MAAALLTLSAVAAGAQINAPGNPGDLLRSSLMLADHNYAGASTQARVADPAALTPTQAEEAAWTEAASAVHLDVARAKKLLKEFIAKYGASPRRQMAHLLLGDCLLATESAEAALAEYTKIDPSGFNASQSADYAYHKAYALLWTDRSDEASRLFAEAAADKRYASASRFYQGYIAYCSGDYARAKTLFGSVNRAEAPGNMADYYLMQIEYKQGDTDAALALARNLLARNEVAPEFTAEAARIAGEITYNTDRRQALAYLRQYASVAAEPELSALYLLGAAEFEAGNFAAAVKSLEPVANAETPDAMAQSALLYIGQALMADGNVDAALMAFDRALHMDFDDGVREAAYYNYAVAKARGARMPFGSSSVIFEEFLNRYPTGRYASRVQEFLVDGYLTDQNYDAALASINRMKNPGDKVLAAKQKVLYAVGTRALAASDNARALDMLRQAEALGRFDRATAALTALSLGQALYRAGDSKGAAEQFKKYLAEAPTAEVNRPLAQYDLGYALFALKDYKGAGESFSKFFAKPGTFGPEVKADALNRLADTKYYANDFAAASKFYGQAFDLKPEVGDYPLFQQAVIKGYNNNQKGKIADINRLLELFPTSSLVPDALLEMTEAYIRMGDNRSAIATYKRLTDEYPATEQGRRGYLQMALTMVNNGDRQAGLDAYRQVVKLYPTSDEARIAIDELKRLAAEDGNLGDFARWLATVKNAPQLDVAEADRLTFDAAEKAWLTRGDSSRLQQYLLEFPAGASRAQALAYIMEEADDADRYADALTFASEITDKYPDSRLAEKALDVKARSLHALGRGSEALEAWTQLEGRASNPLTINTARIGIMRVARDLADHPRVIAAADALLASSTTGSEVRNEAIFSRAQSLDLTGKTAQAREGWLEIAGDTDDLYGAKSAFALAQSYFDGGDTALAQQRVEDLIDSATPHTYWLARAFILLSDIYAAQGKKYEAREYLNSLRENYPGSETDIIEMIDSRRKKL